MGRTDLVHVLDKPEVGNLGDDTDDVKPEKNELSSVRVTPSAPATVQPQKVRTMHAVKMDAGSDAVNAAAKNMQSDAPACNVCGHITLRSGTCYKCLNCGNSMGCS